MRTHSVQNPMKKRAAKPRERPLPIGSPTVADAPRYCGKQDDMRHDYQLKYPELSGKIKFYIGDVRNPDSYAA